MDDGSTITLIDREVARKIGAVGPQMALSVTGIANQKYHNSSCEKVNFDIAGDSDFLRVSGAISLPMLKLPSQSLSAETVRYIAKTESVFVQPYKHARPGLLIGQDNWRLITVSETRQVKDTELALSKTPLGWIVHGLARGSFPPSVETRAIGSVCVLNDGECANEIESLNSLVKQYFEIDSLGVRAITKSDQHHKRALEILKNTTKRLNKKWETGLIWKSDNAPNVDSKTTALKRLFSLEKRLEKDNVYAELYYNEMERFINSGYAQKINDNINQSRIWYLPHFGVLNENKPGKIRLVFDAAAKSSGISLNDQLETGPDLLNALTDVLIKFRQHEVALKADIKDMYLRINVRVEDRGAQRFFWRGRDRKREPEIYEMTCLVFGAKSSPCSAIYVKDANAAEFITSKSTAVNSIKSNFYMDDYLASVKSIKEANRLVRDVVEINARANFLMYGWASNQPRALAEIPASVQGLDLSQMRICDRGGERVLGLFWDTKTDMLGFNVAANRVPEKFINGQTKPTKREFLKIIMSVFDPLGLISPFTIKSKILMQEIWRSGVHWDEQIRDEEQVGWLKWLKYLLKMSECRVPRCVSPSGGRVLNTQLHAFTDASLKAYAAAIYIRFEIENAPAHVILIAAKARVAPLKPLSVPRLELQAALLGARLITSSADQLDFKISKRVLWSDSATIIRWIKSEPRTRQVYVAHRLGEIGELTLSSEWRWVPTKSNPADYATRWENEELTASNPWFVGPSFLYKPEFEWPADKTLSEHELKSIDELEMRKAFVYTAAPEVKELPVTARFLGWRGYLAVARRVRKFVNRWRKIPSEITTESTTDMENYCYRESQSACFTDELKALRNNKFIRKNSRIANINPFIDECGLLKTEGRVTRLIDESFAHQLIILDAKHPAIKLLILEYHRRYFHGSNETVVNELRQRFYIVGLRKTLRSLVSACLICKLRRAKPRAPMMAPLPAGRLAYRQRAFSHCGMDYFGPMMVKIGRRREKRWGVLFTCLSTRAIHLELAHSLTASSAIMALQRLSARRGMPSIIYSDNGTNFRGACKELKDGLSQMDRSRPHQFALQNGLRWIFNPPDAPHMGGAWERLIRSVKVALSVILREQAPNEETLYTLLTEIEHSINSRPLTNVSADPTDAEALTPNHLLIGSSSGEFRLGRYEAQSVCPRKQWRVAQALADSFWRRWLREYVPTLVPRRKWCEKSTPISIGDIVLIIDLQAPRNVWRKGTVVKVFPGADGEIRVATVKTANGEFVRPVHKLILLYSKK